MFIKRVLLTSAVLVLVLFLCSCAGVHTSETQTPELSKESTSSGTEAVTETGRVVHTATYLDETNGVYLCLKDNGVFWMHSIFGAYDYFGSYVIENDRIVFTPSEDAALNGAIPDADLVFEVKDDATLIFHTGRSTYDRSYLPVENGPDLSFVLAPELCFSETV